MLSNLFATLIASIISAQVVSQRLNGTLSDLNCDFHDATFCAYMPNVLIYWEFRANWESAINAVVAIRSPAVFQSRLIRITPPACVYYQYLIGARPSPIVVQQTNRTSRKDYMIISDTSNQGHANWISASIRLHQEEVRITFLARDSITAFANITAVQEECN